LSSRFPVYDRGYKYCSRCGRKMRIKGRNSRKGEDVERIEVEGV